MHRRGVLLGLAALGGCSVAGNLRQSVDFTVVRSQLQMRGTITSRTPAVFAQALAENPRVTTVVLQTVEGSLDDEATLEMGYFIRQRGLATHLQSDSGIYSGGVDLFLAGARRSMVRGAEIGVHSWADGFGEGANYPRDAREHVANARYTADMLGRDDFYWFSLQAAPSDEIYIMNEVEIRQYGLLTQPIQAL